MRHGKRCPEIPIYTPACNHYAARPDATALASADQRLAERVEEKRADIKRLKATLQRLDEELHELELERGESGDLDARFSRAPRSWTT